MQVFRQTVEAIDARYRRTCRDGVMHPRFDIALVVAMRPSARRRTARARPEAALRDRTIRRCTVSGPTISDEELDRLRRLANAASPPPWRSMIEGRDHHSGDTFIMIGPEGDRGEDLYLHRDSGLASSADHDFIASARTDIDALLDEIGAAAGRAPLALGLMWPRDQRRSESRTRASIAGPRPRERSPPRERPSARARPSWWRPLHAWSMRMASGRVKPAVTPAPKARHARMRPGCGL